VQQVTWATSVWLCRDSALHLAAAEGHLEVVRFLVQKGSNVNSPDRWGSHPLRDAVQVPLYLSLSCSLALLLSCSLVIALQARKEGMVGCLDALFLCLRLYILCLVCASIHLPASMSWCPAIIVIVSVCMQQIECVCACNRYMLTHTDVDT